LPAFDRGSHDDLLILDGPNNGHIERRLGDATGSRRFISSQQARFSNRIRFLVSGFQVPG
jgi:hypothetical protein